MARQKSTKYAVAIVKRYDKETREPKSDYAVYVGKVNINKPETIAPWACVAGFAYFGRKLGGQLFLVDELPSDLKVMRWPKKYYIRSGEWCVNFVSKLANSDDYTGQIDEYANMHNFDDYVIINYIDEGREFTMKLSTNINVGMVISLIADKTNNPVYYRVVTVDPEKKFMVELPCSHTIAYTIPNFKEAYLSNFAHNGWATWKTYTKETSKDS